MSIAEKLHIEALKAQEAITKASRELAKEKAAPIIEFCEEVANEWGQMETSFPRGYRYDSIYEDDIVAYLQSKEIGFKVEVNDEYLVVRW